MSTLFYIIGASGSGKDSLLCYARERLAGEPVLFAHRYITRPVDGTGENHITLSEAEFLLRREAGLFSLHWQSHGLYYGIGCEIDAWLGRGLTVVINGSRAYLPEALRRYPQLRCLWIEVPLPTLARRLRCRQRESDAQIAQRLTRAQQFRPPSFAGLTLIDNDNALEKAGEVMVKQLRAGYSRDASASLA